jgi:streptogramin lyase
VRVALSVELGLLDPRTLDTIASHQLPDWVIPPGVSPFQAPGGAYFYLDQRDRAVVSVGRQIFVVAFRNGGWTRDRTYDPSAVITEDDQLNSALPDWSGRLWFVTRQRGIVGVLDPKSGRVLGTHRTGEAIGNSFAMDETGGVFVVTDKVQYRFDAGRAGAPRVSWRCATTTSGSRSGVSSMRARAPRRHSWGAGICRPRTTRTRCRWS